MRKTPIVPAPNKYRIVITIPETENEDSVTLATVLVFSM